ncbi:MAG: Mur ligase family protein [Patescibacteria group bacterium]|jgi:UDP-N-acetylmuramoyl-L-alanyl-D-glutamate--2,6-diaminopimelate ligase|nr:UDP-N-acetylmuramyl-tripeptide synthetase [Patescibacteria group bacterium]
MKVFLSYLKKFIPKKIFNSLQRPYHYFLSFLANLIYARPSSKIVVIGVTGTTGKTSSVYLMAKALNEAGYKTGYTSTAMFGDGKTEWLNDKKMTMIGPFFTQRIIKQMLKNNCRYAIIETTSEGIRQFRHRFINYDILVFTGLYPEHIESHGGFENYKKAKGELFRHLQSCSPKFLDSDNKVIKVKSNLAKISLNRLKKSIIINGDDEHAPYFSSFWAEESWQYIRGDLDSSEDSKVSFKNIDSSLGGVSFSFFYPNKLSNQIIEKPVSLKLWGDFNVSNTIPLLSLPLLITNLDLDKIIKALESIKSIPGRMELIDIGQKFLSIVDYAYEPRAMDKLYELISFLREELIQNGYQGKIIHILGSAGGGRDKSRREVMGRLAGKKADIVIITNEDPYDENPLEIINQVASGSREVGKKEGFNLFRILDRRGAIKKALSLVKEGDILIITGKGCEQAICVANGKKIPWDDRLVLKEEILSILKK